MELIKQIVEKELNVFEVNKRNNKIDVYDYFKALSRINAFLFLKGYKSLEHKDKTWISVLWKAYKKYSIMEAVNLTNREDYENKREYVKAVKRRYSNIRKIYLDELHNLVDRFRFMFFDFDNYFIVEDAKKIQEKPKSYEDIKTKYSIGVLVIR